MEEILKYVKSLGVGCRHPHDEFLKEGNEFCQPIKPFGICDFGVEEFYHKPYLPFSCHIPGCSSSFETVIQYEAHYNSCHSFTCKECKKNFPNNHLLDIHISETHDSFFMELAKRKPMCKCFVEECKEVFMTPDERHIHAINIHKFPSDFRFGVQKKGKANKKVSRKPVKNIGDSSKNENSVINEKSAEKSESNNISSAKFSHFSFGQTGGRRKAVFHKFTHDLRQSLPDT